MYLRLIFLTAAVGGVPVRYRAEIGLMLKRTHKGRLRDVLAKNMRRNPAERGLSQVKAWTLLYDSAK